MTTLLKPTGNVKLTTQLDDAIRNTWRNTFDYIDTDKSGTISRQELRNLLITLDQQHSEAQISDLFTSIGLSHTASEFDFEHFLHLVSVCNTREINRDELRGIFSAFDLDCSGYITAAKLRHFLAKIHIHLNDHEMAELVKMYDLDGDGQITIDEFEVIVRKLGFIIVDDPTVPLPQPHNLSSELIPSQEITRLNSSHEQSHKQVSTLPKSEQPINLAEIADPRIREALELFDSTGTGQISFSDLRYAADMMRNRSSSKRISDSNLHWDPNRELLGLGPYVEKMNHIALIVSDVGRSTSFYVNVMGFQQIRRPNFDRHGAWFTMGNVELHLIKGTPVVHSGDDLIVSHISIETTEIEQVPATLNRLGVPFRQNVSVPKEKDAGEGTNDSDTSNKIVQQYFIRDPDGYYIEICDCDVLTEYSLGHKTDLPGHDELIEPLSLENTVAIVNLMQRWSEAGRQQFAETAEMIDKIKTTDGSVLAVAQLLGCKKADAVDDKMLNNFITRRSVYGDVCQNETPGQLKEIVLASGNNSYIANRIIALRQAFRGQQKMQPPSFYEQGKLVKPPSLIVA